MRKKPTAKFIKLSYIELWYLIGTDMGSKKGNVIGRMNVRASYHSPVKSINSTFCVWLKYTTAKILIFWTVGYLYFWYYAIRTPCNFCNGIRLLLTLLNGKEAPTRLHATTPSALLYMYLLWKLWIHFWLYVMIGCKLFPHWSKKKHFFSR